MATLLPEGKQSFTNSAGAPLVGGKLYTYDAGTSTPRPTYQDAAGTVPNTNPVILDARGEATVFWSGTYKAVLKDASEVTVWTVDQIQDTGSAIAASNAAVLALLAATGGSSIIGWIQSGVGAILRWIQDKLRESVSVKDFGALGDYAPSTGTGTDDTAAFSAAFTSLGAKGGTVKYFDKHLIDNNLTIPPNVTLRGPMSRVGSPGNNSSAPYGNMAALAVNSAATITLGSGAGVIGALAYRKGMVFPSANASAFAGTCFTAGGDDTFIERSMVLGFNKLFSAAGFQRPHITDVSGDNVNGIEISNCLDIPYVKNCHMWPFATIAFVAKPSDWADRSGIAYYVHDTVDWSKFTDCFSYGYARGFKVLNANSTTFKGCGADGTQAYAGSMGFEITGSTTDTRLLGCQSSAQEYGYFVNTDLGVHTEMTGCNAWGNTVSGNSRNVQVQSGDVSILGGGIRQGSTGVYINNVNSRVTVDGVRFSAIGLNPIYNQAASPYVFVGVNDYGDFPVGNPAVFGNAIPTVPSAGTVLLPPSGDTYLISGSTDFGALAGGYTGRRVTLVFQAGLNIFHGGASPNGLVLAGAATYTVAANSTLSLVWAAGLWLETGRKA